MDITARERIFRPSGRLELWRTGQDAQTSFDARASGGNTVVDLARAVLSRMIGGAAPDRHGLPAAIPTIGRGNVPVPSGCRELVIARMQWGTDATPPSPENESLIAPLPLQKGVETEYPSTTSVCFTSVLGHADLNGEILREVALLTHSGLVFARKTFVPEEEKAYAFSWTFRWTITF